MTDHVGHAGDSGPLELVGEGGQAVGQRRLVLELLLGVELLAGPAGRLTVGLGPERTAVAAEADLRRRQVTDSPSDGSVAESPRRSCGV